MEFHLDHSMELCVGSLMDWSIDKNFDIIKFYRTKIQKLGKLGSRFGYLNFSTQNSIFKL